MATDTTKRETSMERPRRIKDRGWGKELLAPLARGDRQPFEVFRDACAGVEFLKDMPRDNDVKALGLMAMMMVYIRHSRDFDAEATATLGAKEQVNASAVAAMVLAGRHIVHFDRDITMALSRSESAGLTVDDLSLPWDDFYMAFDGDGFIEDGYRLDGLIVERREEALVLIPFIADNPVTQSHGMWEIDLRYGHGVDLLEAARRNIHNEYHGDDEDIEDEDAGDEGSEEDSPLAMLLKRNLAVFVNALLYLSAEPDAGNTRWQDGAPPRLVEKASLEDRRAEKAERELHYSHWNKVRYIGSPVDRAEARIAGSPAAHWVRGHFRKQAHGKGRLERKIIWIKPHLSGGSAEDVAQHADVRVVSPTG